MTLPFSLYRPRPGHPDWDKLHSEARALAAELLPTLEAPQSDAIDRRRRLLAHASTLRNYLLNRKLDRMGREDLRPLYFIWTLLRSCNFSCTYCDDHQGHKYPDLPTEGTLGTDAALRLLRIMRTGTPAVYFAGGEPTLRKDLPELTRAARDLSYYPILINTNGSAIHRILQQPRWHTWLADTDVIVVSLDSLDLKLLRTMWDYRRPEDVLRNLLLLRELQKPMRFKLMVNTVIQPGHVTDACDVLDFANDLGIGFCPVPVNVGPTVDGRLHEDPAYAALVDRVLDRKRQGYDIAGSSRMNRRLLRSEPLHCRNTLKPHVDYDGHLNWPCKASVNVAAERIQVLDFEDLDSLYAHACTKVDPTRFHGPAKNQCGANCNWAQNYTTDAYAHGLRNPLSLIGEVTDFLRAS